MANKQLTYTKHKKLCQEYRSIRMKECRIQR